MTFTNFNLSPELIRQIEAEGYVTPTPIQKQAIPVILSGGDVMGLAQTGTGKTAAFVLPILQRLMPGPRGKIRALIIAPTRELVEQINDTIKALGKNTGLRSHTIYGGVGMKGQVSRLQQGIEIIVACPGRLLDHIQQRTIHLNSLEILIFDEADQMFDMGFLPAIKRIMHSIPTQRQTLLFSATMPAEIRRFIQTMLKKPTTIEIAHTRPVEAITHGIYPVHSRLKTDLLLALLKKLPTQLVLIFTRTKHRAKSIDKILQNQGYKCASLQGNLSQSKRQEALNGFREGKFDILVATDIAARGIDVSQVSHVINFDLPDTVEAYTHRIGRTGRATRTGDALSIFSEDIKEDIEMLRKIEKKLGKPIPALTLEGFNYSSTQSSIPKAAFARTSQRRSPWKKK
jgi:ATP-dependent RNA helicase RhlE